MTLTVNLTTFAIIYLMIGVVVTYVTLLAFVHEKETYEGPWYDHVIDVLIWPVILMIIFVLVVLRRKNRSNHKRNLK